MSSGNETEYPDRKNMQSLHGKTQSWPTERPTFSQTCPLFYVCVGASYQFCNVQLSFLKGTLRMYLKLYVNSNTQEPALWQSACLICPQNSKELIFREVNTKSLSVFSIWAIVKTCLSSKPWNETSWCIYTSFEGNVHLKAYKVTFVLLIVRNTTRWVNSRKLILSFGYQELLLHNMRELSIIYMYVLVCVKWKWKQNSAINL